MTEFEFTSTNLDPQYVNLEDVLPDFKVDYEHYLRSEIEILVLLEEKGFKVLGIWRDGEKDSFGPLSRSTTHRQRTSGLRMTRRQTKVRRIIRIIAAIAFIAFCIATEPQTSVASPQETPCAEVRENNEVVICTPEMEQEIEELANEPTQEVEEIPTPPEGATQSYAVPSSPDTEEGPPYAIASTHGQPQRQTHPHRLRRGKQPQCHHRRTAQVLGPRLPVRRPQSKQQRDHRQSCVELGTARYHHV